MCISMQCNENVPLFVELCVNGRGRGHMLWDLFCGCVGAKLLRVFDVCEELSDSQ